MKHIPQSIKEALQSSDEWFISPEDMTAKLNEVALMYFNLMPSERPDRKPTHMQLVEFLRWNPSDDEIVFFLTNPTLHDQYLKN